MSLNLCYSGRHLARKSKGHTQQLYQLQDVYVPTLAPNVSHLQVLKFIRANEFSLALFLVWPGMKPSGLIQQVCPL